MNKDDDLNSEKMVEKCCSCVGWGLRSGTTKRWAVKQTRRREVCKLEPNNRCKLNTQRSPQAGA